MNNFRKNDRVKANYKGTIVHGVVDSVRGGKVKVILDGGKTVLTGSPKSFAPSDLPLPAGTITSLAKGDRVECDIKGQVIHGVIEKGGSGKVKMIADGGKESVTGHASIFRPSSKPLARDTIATPMDRYSVTRYKKLPGHGDCESFDAEISLDGKPILRAYNSGHGGSNEVNPIKSGTTYAAVKDFYEAGKAWAAANGAPNLFEAADTWIDWYVNSRPYSMTSDEYLKQYNSLLNSMK